jgi:hypothetical protein
MKRATYRRFNTNPFKGHKQPHTATIYKPDSYHLNLLCSCGGMAITVLNIIAAHPVPYTDLYRVSRTDILKYYPVSSSALTHSIYMLCHKNIIQKGPTLDDYYINPAIYTKITMLQTS